MKTRTVEHWMLGAAAATILAAIGGCSWWVSAQRNAMAAEAARWKSAEAELRTRLDASERERQALASGQPVSAPETSPPAPSARAQKVVVDDSTTRRSLLQIIEEKDRQLGTADNSLRDLQEKLQEMSGRLQQMQEQQTKLQASEALLRERLDSMAQQAVVLEAAAKAREARLAEADRTNQELRRKTDDTANRLARLQQVADQLEDLARRRDAFVTNILGRYREATDLFRTMSIRTEQPRDNSGTPVAASDVSRIQNAISLAEEDMRQLRGLSTRSSALQKDLREIGRK